MLVAVFMSGSTAKLISCTLKSVHILMHQSVSQSRGISKKMHKRDGGIHIGNFFFAAFIMSRSKTSQASFNSCLIVVQFSLIYIGNCIQYNLRH